MKKVLKNISDDGVSVLGFRLAVNQEYEVPQSEWASLATDTSLHELINSGTIAVLDDVSQMNAEQGLLWVKQFHSGFNPNYFSASSFLESHTSSMTFVRKIRLRTNDIPFGMYRISWCYQWSHSRKKFAFKARVVFDGYDVLWEQFQNPLNVEDFYSVSFFVLKDLMYDGRRSHTIDLEFCSESGHAAAMKNAFLEVFRVS